MRRERGTVARLYRRFMAAERSATTARERRLLLETLLLGAVGAVSAVVFQLLLEGVQHVLLFGLAGYKPPGLPAEGGVPSQVIGGFGLWLVPFATTVGGILVGLLVTWGAPEAEGHGTDTVVRAFHRSGGALRARVPPVKLLASALTIGSGGSGGREGPVALISAGLGSTYARWRGLSEDDTRLLLLIGMSAGLAAIFRSPVGTALFAIEVLYWGMDFEARALLYTTLASVVAYALSGVFLGWEPLFRVPVSLQAPAISQYGWYAILGVAAGIVGTLIPEVFYRMRDLFRRLPVRAMWRPAIGGFLTGCLALVVPEVIGGGYGWVQEAIDGRLPVVTLAALVVAKPIALAFTVSSGGSGGVFAPTLFVGGMLGGLLGVTFHMPAPAFVVVGMAAVFAGAARVPFATMMMVMEMTGGYRLFVPAALAVTISYIVQNRLADVFRYHSLYEAQVRNRAASPAHRTEHLRLALKLLRERTGPLPKDIGRIDLVMLVQSGIPVDLPEGRQLTMTSLSTTDPRVGKMLDGSLRHDGGKEVLAVIREKTMLRPGAEVQLQAGDELLLLSQAEARKEGKAD
ncbi:MAG: chloride channel protein [Gemmatimonadales bacterium]